VTSLRLIELEHNSPKTGELLNLALRSAHEQRSVIDKVLGLLPDELAGLYGTTGGASAPSDLCRALRASIQSAAPLFSEKGVRLSAPAGPVEVLKVFAEEAHLERVIGNLLRHALDHTPTGGEVVASVAEEPDAALFSIEFPHDAVAADEDGTFTPRSDPSSAPNPEEFLRLRFCRIAVEGCHGEMGFRSRVGGGTCAWVRLPKWSAVE
jgi:signal transduction histidine kinase